MPPEVKQVKPEWSHYRVIHSRFPPTNIFDSVNARDQLLLAELEGATNDRLVNWHEWLDPDDFESGPGWGAVMASFCHFSPGRFNNASFGCYYCSNSIHTAVAEWAYHAGQFWRDHRFTDIADATVRSYTGQFTQKIVDVRHLSDLHQDDYSASQAQAVTLKKEGYFGVLFQSVRLEGGLCAGLFKPGATTPVRQAAHYTIHWNGESFTHYAQLSQYKAI